jgi:hypothetical protein
LRGHRTAPAIELSQPPLHEAGGHEITGLLSSKPWLLQRVGDPRRLDDVELSQTGTGPQKSADEVLVLS